MYVCIYLFIFFIYVIMFLLVYLFAYLWITPTVDHAVFLLVMASSRRTRP